MRRFKLVCLALSALFVALPVPASRAQQQSAVAAASRPVAPSPTFAAGRDAAERIKAETMKEVLYYIASDEMAGRDTPSPGLDKTAQYIAERLSKLKLKPAGDKGSYFQRIAMSRTEVDRQNTKAQLGERAFKLGEEFLPFGRTGGEAEGQLVYAGHGWVVRSKGVDSYAGLDVRDKIVVVSGDGFSPPSGVSVENLPGGDWDTPVSYARKNGARALVLIPRNLDRVWRSGVARLSRPSYSVPRLESATDDGDDDDDEPAPVVRQGLVSIIPSRTMLDVLFAGEQADGGAILRASLGGEPVKPFALSPEKRLGMTVSLSNTDAQTQNVVAVLEGKDKKLKKEYVAFGAHYDHVGGNGGGCRPVAGDSICNGADDDGSGTTALLAMAEAFSKGPRPKRSLLFVWHAGEEKGLWGSEYFARFPTVPLQQVVTLLNIDMIGRSKKEGDRNPRNRMLTGPDEIYVIGSKMMSTELGRMSEAVNGAYLNLKFNYHYDEPNDPERMFYRSDHFNYAKKGVPIIFYFDGEHEDYHRPTDHADKIDYDKMQKVARTVFLLGSELANAPQRPVVDKQIPPERMSR